MSVSIDLNDDFNENENRANEARAPERTQRVVKENGMQDQIYNPFENLTNGGLFAQDIIATEGDESFLKMLEIMQKTVAASKAAKSIDIIPFAKEAYPDLHFSVIAVVRNNVEPIAPGLPIHSFATMQLMLVEATGEPLRKQQVESRHRGRSYTITPTSEDVYNTYLVEFVTKAIMDRAPTLTKVYSLDPVIVRRTQKIDETSVKRMLVDAQVAVEERSRMRVPGFRDLNYTKLAAKGRDLIVPVTATIANQTKLDSQGQPIYSDATIDVDLEQQNDRSKNRVYIPNGPNASRRICSTSVMVDLVNVDPELIRGNSRKRSHRDFEPQVAWAPRIIVTAIEQFMTRTPSGIFFGLASLAEMAVHRKWAQTFRTSIGKKTDTLRDIGFLNVEANVNDDDVRYAKPLDTQPGVFGDREMEDFLDATVTPDALFAIDCPTSGPNAYATTMFVALARGDDRTRANAHETLANCLRDATGGLIDDFIDLDNVDIVVRDGGEKFHMGYWHDADLNMRDIREIDNYLAIATRVGNTQPELIQDWSATWLRDDTSEEARMAERLEYLEGVTDGTVVVTGTGIRVSLNAAVVEAFVKALEEGSVPIISRDSGEGDHFRSHRAVAKVTRSSLYRGQGLGQRSSYRRDREDPRENRYAARRY